MHSEIVPVMIQQDGLDTGFASGRMAIAVRAPLQTLESPAPGGGDEPHGEVIIPITTTSQVLLADGSIAVLPPGAEMRFPVTRGALEQLTILAGRMAGYLANASPPVP